MRDGFLMVLSGPSGVGKGTVCEALLKGRKDIKYSISATTRKKRPAEVDGENYYFLSLDEFKTRVRRDEFIEHAKVHGNFYGTPRSYVEENIDNGNIVILEIDVQGALQVKKNFPGAVYIFLLPPDLKELRNRIEKRATEDEDTINLRMHNAQKELSFIDKYDYAVINDKVEDTVHKIECIIEAEKLKATYLGEVK